MLLLSKSAYKRYTSPTVSLVQELEEKLPWNLPRLCVWQWAFTNLENIFRTRHGLKAQGQFRDCIKMFSMSLVLTHWQMHSTKNGRIGI